MPAPTELIYHFYTQETIADAGCCTARGQDTTIATTYNDNVGNEFWDAGILDPPAGERGDTCCSKHVVFNTPTDTNAAHCPSELHSSQAAWRTRIRSSTAGRTSRSMSMFRVVARAARCVSPSSEVGDARRVRTNYCHVERSSRQHHGPERAKQLQVRCQYQQLCDWSISSDRLGHSGRTHIPRLQS